MRNEGDKPEWSEIHGKEEATRATDLFAFFGWFSMDFFQDGHLVTAVRPGEDRTPVIVAVIEGGGDPGA